MKKVYFINRESFETHDGVMPTFRIVLILIALIISKSYEKASFLDFGEKDILIIVGVVYSLVVLFFKKWRKNFAFKYPFGLPVIDILFISCYIFFSGGSNSSLYLFYLIVIIFFATAYKLEYALIACAICITSYSAAVFLADGMMSESVFFRVIFIIFFSIFSGMINEKIHLHIYALATKDSLTSLYNYHYFFSSLECVLKNSMKSKSLVSLAIIDIDDFKLHNDKMGHLGGDQILKEISALIRENVRSNDIASRYGGDEFAIVLPNTASRSAMAICERIREKIQERFMEDNCETVTVSIGIATYPDDGFSCIELFNAADYALYEAKSTGKNATICK